MAKSPSNTNQSKKLWNSIDARVSKGRQRPQTAVEVLLKDNLKSGSPIQLSRYYAAQGVLVFGVGGPPVAGA